MTKFRSGFREPQSIYRLKKAYRGEWLAINVTERNKLGLPVKGTLLARAKSHNELLKSQRAGNIYECFGNGENLHPLLYFYSN